MVKNAVKFVFVLGFTLATGYVISDKAWSDTDAPQPSDDLQAELQSVAPKVTPYVIASPIPMEWETPSHPERKLWSQYLYSLVNEHLDSLDMADDMNQFCQNYKDLNRDQQVEAWSAVFVGIAKWESSWSPTNHTYEDQGIDVITNLPVYSDGLLQLSYQDMTTNSTNDYCPFTWDKDKQLPEFDVHRSIYNPYINLWCGVKTLADIVKADKSINHNTNGNGYWSTLALTGYTHSKVKSIGHEVSKTLPYCGPPIKGQFIQENLTRFANLRINRMIVNTWRAGERQLEKLRHKKVPAPAQSQAPAPVKEPAIEADLPQSQ